MSVQSCESRETKSRVLFGVSFEVVNEKQSGRMRSAMQEKEGLPVHWLRHLTSLRRLYLLTSRGSVKLCRIYGPAKGERKLRDGVEEVGLKLSRQTRDQPSDFLRNLDAAIPQSHPRIAGGFRTSLHDHGMGILNAGHLGKRSLNQAVFRGNEVNNAGPVPPGGRGEFFRAIIEELNGELPRVERGQGMTRRVKQARGNSRTGGADRNIREADREAWPVTSFVADAQSGKPRRTRKERGFCLTVIDGLPLRMDRRGYDLLFDANETKGIGKRGELAS